MVRQFRYPYMEVVSHRLVTELTRAGMGIGVVTKEYVSEYLEKIEAKNA